MKQELNLQSRYKVWYDNDTSTYIFHTKNEIEYRVAFDLAEYLPIDNLYSISIAVHNRVFTPYDVDVQYTIREIVKNDMVCDSFCQSNDYK